MAEFFAEYGMFLLKVLTFVIAIIAVVFVISMAARSSRRLQGQGEIEVRKYNETLQNMNEALSQGLLSPIEQKQAWKTKKSEDKAKAKEEKKAAKLARKRRGKGETVVEDQTRRKVWLLDFHGDIRASAVASMRQEISAILTNAKPEDEVLVRLESGGGMVTSYGLAASQLDRIRQQKIPLTICIDKVAASGGYMMACVADKIIAAPFAVIGSIGVVAQIPNFHRLLKEHNIDFELLTAGKYKRTLTMFGENTDEGREKFVEDIEQIHDQFKTYVSEHRPQLDIDAVATGEVWSGEAAKLRGLIDDIETSDAYIVRACEESDVYQIKYKERKPLMERMGFGAQNVIDGVLLRWFDRLLRWRYY